jgi:hypothetical protein
MKKIYLIGFRGTGFRDEKFKKENALIRSGHVGFYFDDKDKIILGFHPTGKAIEAIGGEEAAIEWLKQKHTLDGTLQQDYSVFQRAAELAEQGARTQVWQMGIDVSDEDFERTQEQAFEWYNTQKVFAYTFPPDKPKDDRDNCATFPRRLGLPVLDPVGQIKDYVQVLQEGRQVWLPKGGEDETNRD